MSTRIQQTTIEEVAAQAGVSRSTVSRVVNGSTAVSAEALAAVQSAIGQLGYVPSRAAQTLAGRQSNAVAFVVPEETERFFGDPFFAAVVAGVHQEFMQSKYLLTLIIAGSVGDKAATYLKSGNVDGVIVASHHTSDTFIQQIPPHLPVVFAGRPAQLREDDCFVDADNDAGGALVAEHLAAQGHSRVAAITGPATMTAAVERQHGFQEAAERLGLQLVATEDGDFSEAGGHLAMQRILASSARPSAVFAASDLMARGVYRALDEAGLRVGHDVSVVGFDDSPVAAALSPALTTVRQPSVELGSQVAEVMMRRLNDDDDPPARATVLPVELVVRGSG